MAITSGFYNSMNGDRKYDSVQMSQLFDGLILDGVYQGVGDAFVVKAVEENRVTVGIGRAWFKHSWLYNDAPYPIDMEPAEIIKDRIDAIVLEFNSTNSIRDNYIYVVKGEPAANPSAEAVRPTLQKSNGVYQYPIAYIMRKAESTSIVQADITNMVGTSECPFVTGLLKVIEIDDFIASWYDQWTQWFKKKQMAIDIDMAQWIANKQSEFVSWFESLQVMLEGDVAANLANEILKIEGLIKTLATDRAIYNKINDDSGGEIEDEYGGSITGRTLFGCECSK